MSWRGDRQLAFDCLTGVVKFVFSCLLLSRLFQNELNVLKKLFYAVGMA